MQKEWPDVKTLVCAESVEANARDKTKCEQLVGYDNNNNNAGSSGMPQPPAKLLPEPTIMECVRLAVSQSSVSTIHGEERRNVFMIALCADNLGEVESRLTDRRPPVELDEEACANIFIGQRRPACRSCSWSFSRSACRSST